MPWSILLGILISTVIGAYTIGVWVMSGNVREQTIAATSRSQHDGVLPHGGFTR